MSLLEATTDVLKVCNMSATMARQGGRVQLEQSDMRLLFNMGKMAKQGFWRASIEETKYLIKKPRAEVREELKHGVEFPWHKKVTAAIQRHPAMLCQNPTSGCLLCQNGSVKNPQTCWTREEQVHLHPPDADSGFQSRLHLRQAPHMPQPVTLPELNMLRSSIYRPDIRICIHLVPAQTTLK